AHRPAERAQEALHPTLTEPADQTWADPAADRPGEERRVAGERAHALAHGALDLPRTPGHVEEAVVACPRQPDHDAQPGLVREIEEPSRRRDVEEKCVDLMPRQLREVGPHAIARQLEVARDTGPERVVR